MRESMIFFSCKPESDHLLHHSKIKFIKNDNIFETAEYPGIKVIVTGVGKKSTLKSLKKIRIGKNVKTYKFGTCAVLDPAIPLLSPFIPSFAGYDNRKINFNLKEFDVNGMKYAENGIYTSDEPVTDEKTVRSIADKGFGFVDMETYHFANSIPGIIPIMIGTDNADEHAITTFFENLNKASRIFSDLFKKIILDI